VEKDKNQALLETMVTGDESYCRLDHSLYKNLFFFSLFHNKEKRHYSKPSGVKLAK
jgi:hypothetical protein